MQPRYIIKMLYVLTRELQMWMYGNHYYRGLHSRSVQGHSGAVLITVCPESTADRNDLHEWRCLKTHLKHGKMLIVAVLLYSKAFLKGNVTLGRFICI